MIFKGEHEMENETNLNEEVRDDLEVVDEEKEEDKC